VRSPLSQTTRIAVSPPWWGAHLTVQHAVLARFVLLSLLLLLWWSLIKPPQTLQLLATRAS